MALHKTDANNNLIQIAGNINMAYTGTSLPIGAIFSSAIPQTSNKYHLLDGGCISIQGIYKGFYNLLLSLVNQGYTITCSADEYAKALSETGNSGRFVINMSSQELVGTYTNEDEIVTNFTIPAYSIKLPTITMFIQGINNITDIGHCFEAGLPNITGSFYGRPHKDGNASYGGALIKANGAFVYSRQGGDTTSSGTSESSTSSKDDKISIDASLSNSIYGNSETVQPQSTQYPYYIVLISGASTNIQANPTITGEEQVLNSINIGGVNYLLGGSISQKVLWTNPNPTSTFEPQTITIEDMSEYDYIILTNSHNDGNTPMLYNSQVLHINKLKDTTYNKGIECIWINVGQAFYRILNITSSTTISVNACYSGNTVHNDVCVPLKIIGIKLIESPTQITNKYSTEETPIGVWIDGKTIYRKICDLGNTAIPIESTTFTNKNLPDSNTIGMIIKSTLQGYGDMPYNNPVQIAINANKEWRIKALDAWGSSTQRGSYLTLEYTKITD